MASVGGVGKRGERGLLLPLPLRAWAAKRTKDGGRGRDKWGLDRPSVQHVIATNCRLEPQIKPDVGHYARQTATAKLTYERRATLLTVVRRVPGSD